MNYNFHNTKAEIRKMKSQILKMDYKIRIRKIVKERKHINESIVAFSEFVIVGNR